MDQPEMNEAPNQRILVVDDNPSIHEDFEKILPVRSHQDKTQLDSLLLEFLEDESDSDTANYEPVYEIEHAYQGEEAFEKVINAEAEGRPFAIIFMDVRMPPGWDGVETIRRIWADYPHNEIVICTAYSDYSWAEILENLGSSDQLQFMRKPFDIVSMKQMALALCKKWNLAKKSRQYTEDLERDVARRTKELREKIEQLEKAMSEIKELRGILPMCAWCHKVRDDGNYWQQVDEYLSTHSLAEISHGICPDCYDKMMNQLETPDGGEGGNRESADANESSGSTGDGDVGDQAVAGRIDLKALREQAEKEAAAGENPEKQAE